MPYLSKAQQRWAHTPEGIKALGGTDKVAEWDTSTGDTPLPERIGKTKKEKSLAKLQRAMQGKHA